MLLGVVAPWDSRPVGQAGPPYRPPSLPDGGPVYGPPAGTAATGHEAPYGYPPAPVYGTPGYGPAGFGVQETSSRAVVALVLAVFSFTCPLLPAVVALVLARGARREIAQSGGRLVGAGLVRAAQVLAWLNVVLCLLAAVALTVLLAAVLTTGPL